MHRIIPFLNASPGVTCGDRSRTWQHVAREHQWVADNSDEPVNFCRTVENMQLTEKLARLQEDGGTDAVAQLQADIALLRAEILRLTDENKRLQTTPKVQPAPGQTPVENLPHLGPSLCSVPTPVVPALCTERMDWYTPVSDTNHTFNQQASWRTI